MRWLSVVRDEADGDGGVLRRSTTVDEYRVEKTPSGQAAFSMARRWRTRCAYSGNVPTCGPSADIATRNRGTRIDWSGPLTEPEWIRGSYSLPYLVSDADVYVISKDGELYFEPARNFASIEMRVDNDLVSTATTAEGTFALDIDQRLANGAFRWASGTHTLSLIARLSDGTSVSRVNERFRIDHDSPTGGVSDPGRTVSGVTAINGSISDADSGPRDWRLQRSPAGQGAWSDICAAADPGPYSCSWDTRQVPDGRYSLRSTLRDRLSEPRGGPNSSTTSVVETIVDNTDPRLELSGWLRAAEDLRPLHDPNRYPLRIDASDSPGSGVRSIEILIDGVRAEFQEAPCELGGCAMQREFTFDPNGYSDGLHMVRVVVTDHAGRATVSEWQIDVEKVVPVPETETETAASASTPNALLGAVNFARSVNAASPEPDLLPCTQPNEAPNFGVYSLGASFEGLPLKALLRRCSVPYPEEGTRANFVSYIYGDCETPVEGDGWCTPPLEIQSWPSCERNITSYDLGPELGPMPYEPLEIQGVPAANIEIGQRIELYAGNTTIVIFGHDPNLVLRAAWAVKKEAAGQPPSPPSTTLPSNAGGGLPQPVAGVLDGTVHCLNSVSDLDELNAVPTHNYMAKRR